MFFLLSFIACFLDKNEETAVPYCEETPEIIEISEEFSEFSWQNWLDTLGESGQVSGDVAIRWEDAAADCLTWQFIPDENTAAYISAEKIIPADSSVAQISFECRDSTEISGSLSLQSGDGRINETIPVSLRHVIDTPEEFVAMNFWEAEVSSWKGTLDAASFTDISSDKQALNLHLSIGENGLQGDFYLILEYIKNDAAWESNILMASFSEDCPDIN